MYAFLDPAGDTLSFSGPTGRGFSVTGQFSETTAPVSGSPLTTAKITATGNLEIESALGNIPLPLPSGTSFVVTTLPNGYNGLFGEVNSAQFELSYSSILTDLVGSFDSTVSSVVQGASSALGTLAQDGSISGSSISLGIGLGSQVPNSAPVNPAVPYIYFAASSGVSAAIGHVQLNVGNYSGELVIDPADPSIYVAVSGLPVVSNIAVGISQNGYIPFTPLVTPSHFSGRTLYGDFYDNASLNLGDLTDGLVPLTLSGNIDFNLNTTGTGWTTTIRQEATSLFQGHPSMPALNQLALGANISAGASIPLASFTELDFSLVGATLIFNGPTQELDVAASTLNPFAGNSTLAFLDDGFSYSLDGYVTESGQFDFGLKGGFNVDGYQVGAASLDVNNSGISATGQTNFLGSQTIFNADFNYNGTYTVSGDVYFNYSADWVYDGYGISGGVYGIFAFVFNNTGDLSLWGSANVYGNVWYAGQSVAAYNAGGSFYTEVNMNNLWNDVEQAFENEFLSIV